MNFLKSFQFGFNCSELLFQPLENKTFIPSVLSWCHEPCLHVAPPSSPPSGVKTKADKTQILRPLRPALTFLSLYTKAIAARNKQTPILGSNWLGCLPTIQPFCQTLLHQLNHCSSQNHKITPKEHHQKITNFLLTADEKNMTPFTIQTPFWWSSNQASFVPKTQWIAFLWLNLSSEHDPWC